MDVYINKDHLALAKNIEVYLKLKPPDCSLFSKDYEEIPIHKEILYQTRFMQEILKSLDCCCCKVEIFCPSLTKHDLEIVVQFLYNGKLLNNRSHTVENENVRNLSKSHSVFRGHSIGTVELEHWQGNIYVNHLQLVL